MDRPRESNRFERDWLPSVQSSHVPYATAPFLTNRKQFLDDVVRPLQNKPETVYVVHNSDAEEFVARRFPHEKTKRVSNGLAGRGTIRAFLRGLNFVFRKGQS